MDASQGERGEVTRLLTRLQAGEASAGDALLPLVYEELRRIARSKMARERAGHTLGATALVHEAFMKLMGHTRVQWESRAHFLSIAAVAMRRILINHAKARLADKRGGAEPLVVFEDHGVARTFGAGTLVALDDALRDLAKHNARQSQVVAYKFFGGLRYEDIAEVLKISVPTVRRDWRFARAWLLQQLSGAEL